MGSALVLSFRASPKSKPLAFVDQLDSLQFPTSTIQAYCSVCSLAWRNFDSSIVSEVCDFAGIAIRVGKVVW